MNIHDNGIVNSKWRVGRGISRRTIYAMVGQTPSSADVLIGMLDEARDAKHVVEVHNASLIEKVSLDAGQLDLLNKLTGKDPDGLRKAVVDFLSAVAKLPGLADAPDSRLIAELRNQIPPPPPRCTESEGATGIRCYRTDDHEIHEGFWGPNKVFIRWPAPDPQTAKRFDGRPAAVCDKCHRYTHSIGDFGELCRWVFAGTRVCPGRFRVPPRST